MEGLHETEAGSGGDATLDFQAALNDPSRWIIKRSVPIFKPHERKDPTTGALIKVDVPKLYRIANNMQQLERGGVPVRVTLGHTEPGKPENQQPPVAGYYRNPRVQPFGPKGEPAVVVDEWLDPQYGQQRKNYPYRSSEYYDDAEQITGVALLTRDPFLDLGVVAYSRGERPLHCSANNGVISHTSSVPGPVRYALNPATGRAPVMYRLTLGELPMFPQGPQPPAAGQPLPQYAPAAPAAPAPQPQYASPPAQFVGYGAPASTVYAAPAAYQGPWPGPQYQQSNAAMPHSNDWQYARQPGRRPAPYAGGEPPMPGGGAGGGPMDGLEAVYEGLSMAVQALEQFMQGASQAPQEPFPPQGPGGPPPGGMDGNPMTPASRYGRPGGYRPRPGQSRPAPRNGQYARYDRGGAVPTTISGQPVGYQLKVDQLQYQLDQSKAAIGHLLKKADEADTNECAAEIRRLAQAGFDVGEVEFRELKAKPTQYRAAYLEHICTKYQKVPTDLPPNMPGDPTPGPTGQPGNQPLSREEMDQALQYAAANPADPDAYSKAIHYMRSGQQAPTQYGAPSPFGDPYAGLEAGTR